MVDCSHANCSKQHERQLDVAREIARQVGSGSRRIFGAMIESHINPGAQKFVPGRDDPTKLAYGTSITDPCLGWDDTVDTLRTLSEAVRRRRGA
jgi:3-deoxy-7-phosphoheptulonate synthase